MTYLMPASVANVSTPSSDRSAMDLDLEMIADIRAGAPAVRARSGRYLPQYEMESSKEYARRVAVAPWRPEFVDSLRALASKPFGSDVSVAEGTPEPIAALVDDIDGRGHNLTQFARHVFTEALANGAHGVLVDYPTMAGAGATLAEERALRPRPYWVDVPLHSIIALRTAQVNGREIITHLRLWEVGVEPDGFGEKVVKRVRVMEPGRWELWEENVQGQWAVVDEGVVKFQGSPDAGVPFVLFFTGERLGTLRTKSPLRDLAEVQIELFRALSRQDEILTYSGSPMLAAVGMAKPLSDAPQISVGPKTILFAPQSGEEKARWEYVSPDAAAIGEIRLHIASIIADMHRLGMQPATPQSGSVTATASAINAAKSHSALEAWANGLKDALEQAFTFTAAYLNIKYAAAVQVFTDFAGGDQSVDEAAIVLQAEAASVISRRTTREELRRRNILGPQFDPTKEARRIASERPPTTTTATPIPPPALLIEEPFKPVRKRRRITA